MYNFRKVKNSSSVQEFMHPNFKKGAFNELGLIQRKKVVPKAMRAQRCNNTREASHKLGVLQHQLEEMLNQNRMLITTNKKFIAKLNIKNKDYSIKEQKLLFMCVSLGTKLLKPDTLRTLLEDKGMREPDYYSEVFDGMDQCYKREMDTEDDDCNFISDLFNTSINQINKDFELPKSVGQRIKNILEKSNGDSQMVNDKSVPKTAFAFRFPKKHSVSLWSNSDILVKDNKIVIGKEDRVHNVVENKIMSPSFNDYKSFLVGDHCGKIRDSNMGRVIS